MALEMQVLEELQASARRQEEALRRLEGTIARLDEATHGLPGCVFCGRNRYQVRMVVGEHAAVCSECVQEASEALSRPVVPSAPAMRGRHASSLT